VGVHVIAARYAEHLYGGPYPFIQTGDIRESGGRITSHKQTYSDAGLAQSRLWPAGTLCITIAANIAETAILTYPACFPDSVVGFIADPTKCDVYFVEYTFRYLRRHIQHEASGTVQDNINLATLDRLKFPLPPLREQQAIACVLGALDDKIELNRRRNRTLEAMARAIFQSWFVDFDPVKAKAEGRTPPGLSPELAALFPDRFDDFPLGPIPAGWRVGTLGEVADNPRRGINADEIKSGTPYIALEHMPRRSIALDDWTTADAIESNKFEFKQGEILFGKLRPYFHKVGIAPVDGVCSTDILVIVPKQPEWFGFCAGHSSSDAIIQHCDRASTGTKMPRTNWNDLARFEVVIPQHEVAEVFTKHFKPMIDRIRQGITESRTLAALRDALLPKLISGELRVPDAERIVGRAT
jgi:type I restriction enzyme S subunit